jgi:hypothetical protein
MFIVSARIQTLILATVFTGMLSACSWLGGNSKSAALEKINYPRDGSGIKLIIRSSNNLNFVNDIPHTLAIAVMQTNSPKSAQTLSQSQDQLNNLLSGKSSANPAIISVDRFIVSPNANNEVTIARRAEVQALVIYAGFFSSPLEQIVRIFQIPIEVDSSGMVIKTYSASPMPVSLLLDLSDGSINDFHQLTKAELDKKDSEKISGGNLKPNPNANKVLPL